MPGECKKSFSRNCKRLKQTGDAQQSELIKKIEDYLEGVLSAAETEEFEAQFAKDVQLQREIKFQQEIMNGMERVALKEMVQRAGARYRRRRRLLRWGLVGLIIMLVISAAFYFSHKTEKHQKPHQTNSKAVVPKPQPTIITAGNAAKHSLAVNKPAAKTLDGPGTGLETQSFFIDASTDTVIETKNGIVFSIPANGFRDESGHTVYRKVELTIKEALTPADIINAGLSTKSGHDLLETGGMFFFGAKQDGKGLRIDAAKPIYAEIPTDSVRAGMQLYRGNQLADGTIDWINPKPLMHDLVPVDIKSLNFYPPNYLDSLAKWGCHFRDKKFTDSLYYSLSALFGASDSISSVSCGIDPAKIKTVWQNEFQNTVIATREFEQRLKWLHKLGNDRYFDMYPDHLDEPLSVIDARVADRATGRLREVFRDFASQHSGRVNNSAVPFKKLREYYRMQSSVYAAAIAKTEADFWDRQQKLDRIASSAKNQHLADSAQRTARNFKEELELNMKSAYRQLGIDTSVAARRATTSGVYNEATYNVQIETTGWCNIDRAVSAGTLARTTIVYADDKTGKQAVINYSPVSFTITDAKTYDQLSVYLLPDRLRSFMRLTGTNGKYTEKLNELIKYKLVCVGYYKNEAAFFYTQNNVSSNDYPAIALRAVSKSVLEQALNRGGAPDQAVAVQNENAYFQFEIKDQKRQKQNKTVKVLRGGFDKNVLSLPHSPR